MNSCISGEDNSLRLSISETLKNINILPRTPNNCDFSINKSPFKKFAITIIIGRAHSNTWQLVIACSCNIWTVRRLSWKDTLSGSRKQCRFPLLAHELQLWENLWIEVCYCEFEARLSWEWNLLRYSQSFRNIQYMALAKLQANVKITWLRMVFATQ